MMLSPITQNDQKYRPKTNKRHLSGFIYRYN